MMKSDQYAETGIVRAAAKAPYLERDEEHELAVRWAQCGDQQALHKLAASHMRLVISVAARFRKYGLSMGDMVQEGHVGLLEAAARFDPHRGVRFSTYATWWIRASIQDYVLRNWSIVRGGTSSNQKSLFFNLRHLRARILRSGQPPNSHELYKELSRAIGVSITDVANMDARLSGSDVSLNVQVSEDENSAERMDYLADNAPLPDEMVETTIDSERRSLWLAQAMVVLTGREKRIIAARKLADDAATLEELGDELGISKERVRQIETRAMEKLKQALTASHYYDAG